MVLLPEGRLCPGPRRRDGGDSEPGAVQPGGVDDGSLCRRRAGKQGACQAPAAADRLTPHSARPPTASHRPGGLAAGSTPPHPSLPPRPSSPPAPSLTEGLRCLWEPLLLQRHFHQLLLRSTSPPPIAHRARVPFPSYPAPCALGQRFLASPDHVPVFSSLSPTLLSRCSVLSLYHPKQCSSALSREHKPLVRSLLWRAKRKLYLFAVTAPLCLFFTVPFRHSM